MAVALLTGCSSGFGLLSAVRLAEGGMTVVATVRDLDRDARLRCALADAGVEAEVDQLDVTDVVSVDRSVEGVLSRHGRIDVLVNNAGVGLEGAVEATTIAQAHAVFDTNLFGMMRVTQVVLPIMRNQGAGVIVNISSLAALVTNPYSGVYSASKRALEAVCEALHYEVSPHGIRIAVIEPGSFPTAFGLRPCAVGEVAPIYDERMARWNEAYARLPGKGEPADPARVADAVFEAATDPGFPLRRLVGDDAEMIAALRGSLDDAAFEEAVRGFLSFWD